ncbi:MAG: hypothetical protein Q9193_006342 [Seirophora villosa]
MAWRDDWPLGPDGKEYDGKHLMDMVRNNSSPFHASWDVRLLIREVEVNLGEQVTDIPVIDKGSNNYGFHLKTSSQRDLVARLARGDVNMPDFDGLPIEKQVPEALFEAGVYELLHSEPAIPASHLLYYRAPKQHPGPRLTIPRDIKGRRLFVFERAQGYNNAWDDLNADSKCNNRYQLLLLDQLANIRAALFRYNPPLDFAARHLHDRIFDFKPESFDLPVAPHANSGSMSSNQRSAQQFEMKMKWLGGRMTSKPSGLLPTESSLYRLVLEHGDFGIHNTSITRDVDGNPLVTSLYDWETACIVPALLSDPLVAAGPVDLSTGDDGELCVTRIPNNPTGTDLKTYESWAHRYIEKLYRDTPDYSFAINAGKDARYLWFALRDWRGGNSEVFFGGLGMWAEQRVRELSRP